MKKYLWILFLIIFIFLLITVNYLSNRHITAVFKDARPFDNNIEVYYKGKKIGKAVEKHHSEDSQRINVKITLYNKNLKLPLNTKAVLKKRIKNDKDFDYIELAYPEIPSERFIKENSHINGSATVDVKEYLKNQTPEDLDKIKTNLMSASENLNSSLSAIGGMFILIQDILNDNRDNLKNASSNLKNTTKNINNVTKKFDNIIIEEQWNNTFGNIEKSSNGVNNFAQNINKTVNDIDRTIPITLENTKEITANLNSISCGIRQTLSKKFGGLRLFFGRVINEN